MNLTDNTTPSHIQNLAASWVRSDWDQTLMDLAWHGNDPDVTADYEASLASEQPDWADLDSNEGREALKTALLAVLASAAG